MKKIDKGDSPEWFETWKQNCKDTIGREAHYKKDFSSEDNDGKRRRQRLRNQLIEEQGYICCYCMKRISLDSSHIEHFWPKTFFPQIDLDYNNMFASCNGDGIIGIDGHCGHKKEDWWEKDMIPPTEAEIEKIFQYSVDGRIHSVPGRPAANIAQEMITQMGLNSFHLKRNRREAIENSEVFDEEEYSDQDIRDFIDYYANKDNGFYIPYCMAIVDCLKDCL
ncbi:TIGR02646 family protein [bacterium 1xD8-6]|jgi:TIGR02646 family protein|nr:TIGR02646 family protein [bacterium D16-36]RKI72349.1 TIGR02646 family protein [bacterium 1xD8-6]